MWLVKFLTRTKEKIPPNPTKCSCGHPIPPQLLMYRETLGIQTRVHKEVKYFCLICGKEYKLFT